MSWRDKIRSVTPYVPGEQPKVTNLIKLNTNENPYPPAPKVFEALENLDGNMLKLYPDPEASELTQVLSDYYGLNKDQVFLGNGSDEVLALAFLTYFNSDQEILFPDITYSFYPVYGDLYQIKYRKVPLNENFEMNIDDYKVPNGGIIFPNPNAPTSIALAVENIEEILKANPDVVVIVDEAYVDFGAESAVRLIDQYDNLLIIQTFSKARSLAGLRMGIALGSVELITHLKAIKNSFNSYPLDYVAQTLATASVKDVDYLKTTLNKIIATREATQKALKQLGFIVADSKTNFLFVTHKDPIAKDLFEYLKANRIYVRHFNLPRIDNHLRITIGTDEQMQILMDQIKNFLENK